jgi:hypothetical protein
VKFELLTLRQSRVEILMLASFDALHFILFPKFRIKLLIRCIILFYIENLARIRAYTCIGGVEISGGNGGRNHLNTWGQVCRYS